MGSAERSLGLRDDEKAQCKAEVWRGAPPAATASRSPRLRGRRKLPPVRFDGEQGCTLSRLEWGVPGLQLQLNAPPAFVRPVSNDHSQPQQPRSSQMVTKYWSLAHPGMYIILKQSIEGGNNLLYGLQTVAPYTPFSLSGRGPNIL